MVKSTRLNQQQAAALRAELWFYVFHGLGDRRSLAAVHALAVESGHPETPSLKTIRRWSASYGWLARAAELDAKARVKTDAKAIDRAIEINERQAILGRAMQQVGAQVVDRFTKNPAMLAEAGLNEASLVIERGAKLERLASGIATERAEIIVGVWTTVVDEIASLFMRCNDIDDREERKREFAFGFDEVARGHVAGYLSPGHEEESSE